MADAAKKRDAGAFILDVRTPEEWNEYHVPGSTLIPIDELPKRVAEVPKDKEVVVVCRSGNRSATGRDVLLKAGYPQVTSLAGGLKPGAAPGSRWNRADDSKEPRLLTETGLSVFADGCRPLDSRLRGNDINEMLFPYGILTTPRRPSAAPRTPASPPSRNTSAPSRSTRPTDTTQGWPGRVDGVDGHAAPEAPLGCAQIGDRLPACRFDR